jgi:hypothetical protein
MEAIAKERPNIPLTIEISVFTSFKSSEGYIAEPEAEQSNTYSASKKAEFNSFLVLGVYSLLAPAPPARYTARN